MNKVNKLKRILTGGTTLIMILCALSLTVHAAPEDEQPAEDVVEEVPQVVKPTLNAAISEKSLTVNALSEKGIRAIYVNGYRFENTGNGNLKIKLTQFDAGYKKFYIYAEDMEGIASDIYEVENPYFDTDPKDDKDPSKELPEDASPTEVVEAQGEVSEYMYNSGREFYTIETINGKTFYLIVDMNSDEDKVYFLTEISERDLLNATSDTSETLPRNSAIPEEGIPGDGVVITNNNASQSTIETVFGKEEVKEPTPEKKPFSFGSSIKEDGIKTSSSSSSIMVYVLMGVIGVIVIVVVTVIKRKKRKEKDLLDSDEEETEEES